MLNQRKGYGEMDSVCAKAAFARCWRSVAPEVRGQGSSGVLSKRQVVVDRLVAKSTFSRSLDANSFLFLTTSEVSLSKCLTLLGSEHNVKMKDATVIRRRARQARLREERNFDAWAATATADLVQKPIRPLTSAAYDRMLQEWDTLVLKPPHSTPC